MFKQEFETKNKSIWKNTCEYIVLHHTWTKEWTLQGNINVLTWKNQNSRVSAHYLIDTNGDIYKIWNDSDILWHAWTSTWKGRTNINRFSIWIEIIWPLSDGGFTDSQKESVAKLVQYLANLYSIPQENVLRHKDITGRKWDVADTLWNWNFKTWEEYKKFLFDKNTSMTAKKSKYTEIMQNALKEVWSIPIFGEHTGENPITEQETKELIEIAFARFTERLYKTFKNIWKK